MKSFISEEKTVLKAIEHAMVIACNPKIFTVKILEAGITSIFWWKNKAAIILFSYEIENIDPKEQKKYVKKNYSKEEAFNNHKITNQFQEQEYISTKNEKLKEKEGLQKEKQPNLFNSNKQLNSNKQQTNIKEKELILSSNPFEKNIPNKDIIKEEKVDTIKKLIHQSKNKNLLQEPLKDISNQEFLSKKNHTKKEKKIYKINELSISPLANALQNNQNQETSILTKLSTASKSKEWEEKHILFIDTWMQNINQEYHFSLLPINVFLENEYLIIDIKEFNTFEEIEKKHLFSSIIVLLHEHLRKNFENFNPRDYKIEIR